MSFVIARRSAPATETRRLNQFLDEAFAGWPFATGSVPSAWQPSTDIFEDANGIHLIMELPGVAPEQVKLTLENQVLTVRGEKKQVASEQTTTVHRYERSYGSFERTFSLPNTVDSDRVQATFEHGVLTVLLPKAEKAKAREIQVGVK
jgi:HSP20 family protein